MTVEENGRLARIEEKLDNALKAQADLCAVVYHPQTGAIAHEQRISVMEGRTRAIIAISTAVLLAVLALGAKLIFGG